MVISKENNGKWLWWFLAVTWAGFIFWLSSSPDTGSFWLLEIVPYGDKVAHGVAFGILAFLLYMAIGKRWVAIIVTSLYGLSDEGHQWFRPGRTVDITDWVVDTLGALLVVTLVSFLTRGSTKKSL